MKASLCRWTDVLRAAIAAIRNGASATRVTNIMTNSESLLRLGKSVVFSQPLDMTHYCTSKMPAIKSSVKKPRSLYSAALRPLRTTTTLGT